jgi:hypothetical protein
VLAVASTVSPAAALGAHLLANEDLIFFKPQPDDHFARALATGDFNGDGVDDLATGIPFDDGFFGFEKPDVGAVVVRYGAPKTGFPPDLADAFLSQLAGGSPDPGEADDRFGAALAACDFNGDGFDDLAVGVPGEDGGDDENWGNSGAVDIHYGFSDGLETVAEQHLTEDTPGIPGEREPQDAFGFALACGDIDGDGFADLAVGVPQENIDHFLDTVDFAGTVIIVPGSVGGLDPAHATEINEDDVSSLTAEDGDQFGHALAIGNFDSDGFADLAIGAPGEDGGTGLLLLVFGAESGLTGGSTYYTEDYFGDVPEPGDQFASVLAVGDFDHDLFADLAIGVPHETFGDTGPPPHFLIGDAGAVAVLYGQNGGPARPGLLLTEASVAGSVTSDLFGFALAAGDLDGDGFDDLAIGAPAKAVTGTGDGGVIEVMGSGTGLVAARHKALVEGDLIAGTSGVHDLAFGYALAAGDFDGDHVADLVIGAPDQDGPGGANVGAEVVLYGGLLSDGFESGLFDLWSGETPP